MPPVGVQPNGDILSGPDIFSWFVAVFNWLVAVFPSFVNLIKSVIGTLVGVSIPVSIFFLIAIIYTVERLKEIRNKEGEIYDKKVEPAFEEGVAPDMGMQRRFEDAKKHIESPNTNDWKQAIIEMDMVLDDLLLKMGYRGESVGEKLKRVATGDMKSLNNAWEAHKVRNRIAHEPGFVLDHHVAKETFHNYKKVFEEFYYV